MLKTNLLAVCLLALLLVLAHAHKSKEEKEKEKNENYGQRNKDLFNAINKARTNPKYFSKKIQDELDKKFVCDSTGSPTKIQCMDESFNSQSAAMCQVQVETIEGPPCWTEAKNDIEENAKKLKKLKWHEGLAQACYDLIKDSGPLGRDTHTGYDGSEPIDRIDRYGTCKSSGESLSFGECEDAENIVTRMLVDDGVSDRGNRGNILDKSFTHIGVSCGCHLYYGEMCCIAYAEKMVGNHGKHKAPVAPRVDQCYPYDSGYALGLQSAQSYFYDSYQSAPIQTTKTYSMSQSQSSGGYNFQDQSESVPYTQHSNNYNVWGDSDNNYNQAEAQVESSGNGYSDAQTQAENTNNDQVYSQNYGNIYNGAQAQAQSSGNEYNGAQSQAESNSNGFSGAQAQSESNEDGFNGAQAQAEANKNEFNGAQSQAEANGSNFGGASAQAQAEIITNGDLHNNQEPCDDEESASPVTFRLPLSSSMGQSQSTSSDPSGPTYTFNQQESEHFGDDSNQYYGDTSNLNIDQEQISKLSLRRPSSLNGPLMGPLSSSGPGFTVKIDHSQPGHLENNDQYYDDSDDSDDSDSDDISAIATATSGDDSATATATIEPDVGPVESDSDPCRSPPPVHMQKWSTYLPNGSAQYGSYGNSY